MPRIIPLTTSTTAPDVQVLLDAVQAKLGMTPNLYRTVAHSPATLKAVLRMGDALSKGRLSSRFGEQLALVTAEVNGCDYCLSAHSALAGLLKLPADEVARNRDGDSSDLKSAAGLHFAQRVTQTRGHVSDADVNAVQAAGYSDAEMTEIIAHVALNTFTNYFNSVAQTDIDFPAVASRPRL